MIFLCYGMHKSASTFAFQLSRDLASIRSDRAGLKSLLPEPLRVDFIDHVESPAASLGAVVEMLDEYLPAEEIYVVKTHQPLDDATRQLLNAGRVKAAVSFRDPYDVMASLLDAGNVERRRASARQRQAFARIFSVLDAIEPTLHHMNHAKTWLRCDPVNVCRIPFTSIANRPLRVARDILRQMGIDADPSPIVARYQSDKKATITEFNRGEEGRGRKLRPLLEPDLRAPFDHFVADYLGP